MEYGFYLSYNNQEQGFRLPVNPGEIEVMEGGNGKVYEVAGLGEINVIKSPKLTEITLESFFPATKYPFVVGSFLREPEWYVHLINEWRETKRPIRFVFTGGAVDINMAVSIEKFDWKEVAGEEGDIQYKLSLKRYEFYAAKKVMVVKNQKQNGTSKGVALQKGKPQRPDERQPPKTYTIASGDTLWKISKQFLGDGSRYKEIQRVNGLTDAQVKALKPGTVLKMPDGGKHA